MCGCDECVIREDTLGWSVVGTLEREVLGRDCIMESGVGGGPPERGVAWPSSSPEPALLWKVKE